MNPPAAQCSIFLRESNRRLAYQRFPAKGGVAAALTACWILVAAVDEKVMVVLE